MNSEQLPEEKHTEPPPTGEQPEQPPAEEHRRRINGHWFACTPAKDCGITDPTNFSFTEGGVEYRCVLLDKLDRMYRPTKVRSDLTLEPKKND